MIVRQFLLWAHDAPSAQRAEAATALAQAYLERELSPRDRRDARTALTAMLDDPSPVVRQALAEALADSPESPRHVVVALANDHASIATVVLARSPVLTDADLIDCAALGDEAIQTAIASRPYVSVATSAALSEIAGMDALVTLARNPGAELPEAALWRMVERHQPASALAQALLRRPNLPLDLRHAVALAVSNELAAVVSTSGWLGAGQAERTFGDAREKATLALAAAAPFEDVHRLVSYLRRTKQLTAALILRALLSRAMVFVEAAFVDLTGVPAARVAGLLYDRAGLGFSALYSRAGLPEILEPAFRAALLAVTEMEADTEAEGAQLSQRMIERVLTACAELPGNETWKLEALLRRYDAEAARENARSAAEALAHDAARAVGYDAVVLIEAARDPLPQAA
jgi:uncharacterized protein (DUF2336 family)